MNRRYTQMGRRGQPAIDPQKKMRQVSRIFVASCFLLMGAQCIPEKLFQCPEGEIFVHEVSVGRDGKISGGRCEATQKKSPGPDSVRTRQSCTFDFIEWGAPCPISDTFSPTTTPIYTPAAPAASGAGEVPACQIKSATC